MDHNFPGSGTYQVKLTVTDAASHTGTKTVPVTVTNVAPAVGFVAAGQRGRSRRHPVGDGP